MQYRENLVSIIILVHNAPGYTKHTLKTLKETKSDIPYEVIVLDNASREKTKKMLKGLKAKGWIDKLILSDENTLFSKGNNIASEYVAKESKYILLLNSDIEIRNCKWLDEIFAIHKKGITALGCSCLEDNRPDGFCYFIDRDLFELEKLDESYAWFFSLAKLSAKVLNMGYNVNTIAKYDNLLYHYGGKSGRVKNASGMDTKESEIALWFGGKKCTLIERLEVDENNIKYAKYSFFNLCVKLKLKIKPYRKKIKKLVIKYKNRI